MNLSNTCRESCFIAALFLAATILMVLIPPFQSPDEFDHIKRAYYLSNGVFVLDSENGVGSGGYIDTGLAAFMAHYERDPYRPSNKISSEAVGRGSSIKWSGSEKFSSAPGTGYYFPIAYVPQAIGLSLGRLLGVSVDSSYRLARYAALSAACAILLAAFRFYRPPLIVLVLLVIPMSLFQFSSASLDGVSIALAILAVSTFIRIVVDQDKSNFRLLFVLSLSIFVLASCRVHLAPLVLLIFGSFYFNRNGKAIFLGFAVSAALIAWYLVAIKTTVDLRVKLALPMLEIVRYYFQRPSALFEVIVNTVADREFQIFYSESFVGVLGWLDTKFSEWVYLIIYFSLFVALLLSIPYGNLRSSWMPRGILIFCSLGSILTIFLALLFTWTPHPATNVLGVQGRYFLIPIIIIGYAISFTVHSINRPTVPKKYDSLFFAIVFVFSCQQTTQLLLDRYYTRSERRVVEVAPTAQNFGELVRGRYFQQSFVAQARLLLEMKIFLATFARNNTGFITIELSEEGGRTIFSTDVDVGGIKNNDWFSIPVERLPVVEGRRYQLQLGSLNGAPGNAVTWLASPDDAYSLGRASVDSVLQQNDFAFRIVFTENH